MLALSAGVRNILTAEISRHISKSSPHRNRASQRKEPCLLQHGFPLSVISYFETLIKPHLKWRMFRTALQVSFRHNYLEVETLTLRSLACRRCSTHTRDFGSCTTIGTCSPTEEGCERSDQDVESRSSGDHHPRG